MSMYDNLLLRGLILTWDRLIGRRYPRYIPDTSPRELDWPTRSTISYLYSWGATRHFTYLEATELLKRGQIEPLFHYRHLTKHKREGGIRHLYEPDALLKQTQQRLLQSFIKPVTPHPACTAYRRGYSIADHVWPHAGARVIITADLRDFFPSTRTDRVYNWWLAQLEYSEQAARLATLLTTYRGGLPQGAPTSPALSNLVNFELDQRLTRRVQESGGIYTRYADDMVFSWQTLRQPPADFAHAIRQVIHEYGYEFHPQKGWNIYSADDEPTITGVVLRKRGRVTITDEMRQIIQQLERTEPHSPRLAGYKGFREMIEKR